MPKSSKKRVHESTSDPAPQFSRKRARESSNVNTDLVKIYEDLASEDNETRLDAALRLLSLNNNDGKLPKVLKRLFRGLCSGRKAARLGFSIALTEFLARHVTSDSLFTVEQILAELKEQTDPTPGAAGQELRDYYFGRLFAIEALIKSKILLRPGQEQHWLILVSHVLELYHKKQWLREECGWVLQQALVSIRGQPAFLPLLRQIFEVLRDQKFLQSLEGIAIRVIFRPDDSTTSITPDTAFSDGDPLSVAERTTLLNALRSTVTSDGDEKPSKSTGTTWSSKLHFAWTTILEAAWKAEPDGEAEPPLGKQRKPNFTVLWTAFVEEHLFANAATEQRKYWGFLMVQHFTKTFKDSFFSSKPNFLRCFCNQLSKSDRHLHGVAGQTSRAILLAAQTDDDKRFAGDLLVHMVGQHGWVDFDKITQNRFLEKLIALATPEQQGVCLMALNDLMADPDRVPRDLAPEQFLVACADFVVTLVKNYKAPRNSSGHIDNLNQPVMSNAITILVRYGFLQIYSQDGGSYVVAEKTRSSFRGRLFSLISHSIIKNRDPSTWAAHAANILLSVDYSVQPSPMSQFDRATIKKIKHAGKTMTKCGKNIDLAGGSETIPGKNIKVYQAFRLVFALSIIQTLAVDAEALNMLEELENAYSTNLEDKKEDGEGSNGIVDIILSLVSRPSVLFRRVGKEMFSSLTATMTQADLDTMFDVLLKRENLAGQQELFDAENSEESPDDDSDSQAESDEKSDVDMLEAAEEDADELVEFENKLASALGTRRAEDDLENGAAEDSDEDLMDDEQMAALDPVMSDMFKARRKTSQKKENKNAKQTIVQFKNKVLELLEIYVQQEAKKEENAILVTIPEQCLACIQVTTDKLVGEKAASIIKTASNLYKLSASPKSEKHVSETARKELRAAQARVILPGSNSYVRSCSQASLLLAKIMLNNGASIEEVWKEYCRTGRKMATDEDAKPAGILFQDWFNWLTTAKLALSKRAPME